MQHYLETLNALITDKIVNVEDYYVISLSRGVQLQGKYTNLLVTELNNLNKELSLDKYYTQVDENGYVSIGFRYNSSIIDITLT